MQLDPQWVIFLEQYFGRPITDIQNLNGGDINKAISFKCFQKRYFLKYNAAPAAYQMFNSESEGLQLLASSNTIKTIQLKEVIQLNEKAGLLLNYVESGEKSQSFWEGFGRDLNNLHSCTSEVFGLSYNNFIGSLLQVNDPKISWSEFYAHNRILPMTRRCFDAGLLNRKNMNASVQFCHRLGDIYPNEKPALLHGDLWSGNFICNPNNEVVLIDPAVYYGHREMDIAMSKLFGGFDESFYASYNEYNALTPGWKSRMKYSQLYYLLVHLALFGRAYYTQVASILKEFTS